MRDLDPSSQHDLIGYVLGTLDDDEHAVFDARVVRDPELAGRVEALRRTLQPLDAWDVPAPDASAVDAIMKRVKTTSPLEYVAASTALPPVRGMAPSRRSFVSLREVLALAACIALIVGVFVPGMSNVRARRLQMACGDNLARFGTGLQFYANENDNQLPRVPTQANWIQQPNRMHLVPAIALQLIAPENLYCPTTPADALSDGAPADQPKLFLRNVRIRFYSPQNMNGPMLPFGTRTEMPLAGDPNPMFPNGAFDPNADRAANSDAHGGRGQNVLLLNGSVRFFATPVMPTSRDNIWQAENVEQYTGTEAQQSATDAFLIP